TGRMYSWTPILFTSTRSGLGNQGRPSIALPSGRPAQMVGRSQELLFIRFQHQLEREQPIRERHGHRRHNAILSRERFFILCEPSDKASPFLGLPLAPGGPEVDDPAGGQGALLFCVEVPLQQPVGALCGLLSLPVCSLTKEAVGAPCGEEHFVKESVGA